MHMTFSKCSSSIGTRTHIGRGIYYDERFKRNTYMTYTLFVTCIKHDILLTCLLFTCYMHITEHAHNIHFTLTATCMLYYVYHNKG